MSPPTVTVNLGSGRTALDVSTTGYETCALLDDKGVACWGQNTYGELGLGDTTVRRVPTRVNLGTGATASVVRASYSIMCVLLSDGNVKCWGANSAGSLGMGDTISRGATPATTP